MFRFSSSPPYLKPAWILKNPVFMRVLPYIDLECSGTNRNQKAIWSRRFGRRCRRGNKNVKFWTRILNHLWFKLGACGQKVGLNTLRKEIEDVFREEYRKAPEVYEETRSVTKTITIWGYPARRQTLYNRINRKRTLPKDRSTFCGYHKPEHPCHPPIEWKLEILHRCFELEEDVQSVTNEVGYSTASIYNRRRKYIQKGAAALMNLSNERNRGKQREGKAASLEDYICLPLLTAMMVCR
jgi:hypothetical protein